MGVANGLESADVERHRQWRRPRFRGGGEWVGLLDMAIRAARRQRTDQTLQPLGDGVDHRLFTGHDDVDRVLAEEGGPDGDQPGDDLAQLPHIKPSQPANLVKHSDPLQTVVDSAFGAELGGGPEEGELKAETCDRALPRRGASVYDRLEPRRRR